MSSLGDKGMEVWKERQQKGQFDLKGENGKKKRKIRSVKGKIGLDGEKEIKGIQEEKEKRVSWRKRRKKWARRERKSGGLKRKKGKLKFMKKRWTKGRGLRGVNGDIVEQYLITEKGTEGKERRGKRDALGLKGEMLKEG